MAGLSQKDQKRLLDHVEKQGVAVTATTKGYLLRMPDGKTAMLHKTQSDRMAPMALRATLKRSGISWPFDGATAELPKYITEGTMRDSTIDRYRRAVQVDGEFPDEVFPQELARAEHELRNPGEPMPKAIDFTRMYRALYRLGYVPGGRYEHGRGKAWVRRPEEVVDKPMPPMRPVAPASMFTPEVEPSVEAAPEPEAQPEPQAPVSIASRRGGREFIDSVESWTVDPDGVSDLTLDALVRMMRATGLEVEIRVWKQQ